ncbi:DUF2381 family protein [Corallococcus macrosporus]|uniref:DUF2381 family protein n=1 Tax=Corallococcus macrosporus DSM 14697 TaxID=1189310 RepID=A0A250JNF8_9BACT|nr:DUF2381 family protein [Corallococcus macrosporus]ATB44656.1 hypothetical protein MYMAC_000227 [Corallococcus macrosporus DSM 14697]
MHAPSFALLITALLMGTGTASAERGTPPCQTGVRHIELPATAPAEPAQVCISPGQSTLINFDGALVPGSMTLEGEERFTQAEPGPSSLKLVPSEKLTAGERLRLTVRFQGSAAPSSATLLLVVHPAQAEPLVDIHRLTRTVESYHQELRAREAQLHQLREENHRLRAESAGPGGLAGLHAAGLLDDKAFMARDSTASVRVPPASALIPDGPLLSFRASNRVAVTMRLLNPEGAAPWVVQDARMALEGKKGVELKVLKVWPAAPIQPGKTLSIAVEAEASGPPLQGPFTLRLWEATGGRTAIIQGVMLP